MGVLEGRVAVITGAGRGIGREHALLFAAEGAAVVVNDLGGTNAGEGSDSTTAQQVVDEIVAAGGRAVANTDSVSDWNAAEGLVQQAIDEFGRLDVLVNNAGLGGQTPVIDMTDEEWDRVLDVTLTSVMRATRAALRYFRDADHGGVIVNNASVLGWRAQHSQSHYAAAKAGVMALTRCSAIEAVEHGVRINAVSPSIARHKFLEKTSSADLLDRLSEGEAFGRAAEPWEVAATIAFLASDYSSYLTGEVISVSSQHP